MSYLHSQGHPHANRYAFAKVWSECDTARRRVNQQIAFQAGIDKLVQVAVQGGKKGQALFKQQIKELSDGGST